MSTTIIHPVTTLESKFLRYVKPTALGTALGEAIRNMQEHEPDHVANYFKAAVAPGILKDFVEREKVKLSSATCPLSILGKHCSQNCALMHWPPGYDHQAIWSRDGKPCIVTYEPYDL